jgi:septum formation protein
LSGTFECVIRGKNVEKKKLILASRSPRRKALLEGLGLTFDICPAEVDEGIKEGESPKAHTMRLAAEKAERAALARGEGLIIGADTVVVIDEAILGKPGNLKEAKRMLKRLSGRTHTVVTAFCVLDKLSGKKIKRAVESRVKIKEMTGEEIDDYLKTGEPLDKAGAYAIQGIGKFMVEGVEGSYTNVVGLPMEELEETLMEFGVTSGHE